MTATADLFELLDAGSVVADEVPCRDRLQLFFSKRSSDVAEAVALCELCPERLGCLEASLVRREMFGTWGGVSEERRRKLFQQDRIGRKAS